MCLWVSQTHLEFMSPWAMLKCWSKCNTSVLPVGINGGQMGWPRLLSYYRHFFIQTHQPGHWDIKTVFKWDAIHRPERCPGSRGSELHTNVLHTGVKKGITMTCIMKKKEMKWKRKSHANTELEDNVEDYLEKSQSNFITAKVLTSYNSAFI